VTCSFSGRLGKTWAWGFRMKWPLSMATRSVARSAVSPTETFRWTPESEVWPTMAWATVWSLASSRSMVGTRVDPKSAVAQRAW